MRLQPRRHPLLRALGLRGLVAGVGLLTLAADVTLLLAALRGWLGLLALVAALVGLRGLVGLRSLVGLGGLIAFVSHRSRLPSAWRREPSCGRDLRPQI